jgi:DNA-binding beta-propeller fold protein YncE
VAIYARDASSGALSLLEVSEDELDGATAACDLVIAPDGHHLYVTTNTGITILARDAVSGLLSAAGAVPGQDIVQLTLSPDGSNLYGLAWPPLGGPIVIAFARDSVSGGLTHLEDEPEPIGGGAQGGGAGMTLAMSPDGRHLYSTAGNRASIGIFARDAASGEITLLGTQDQPELGSAGPMLGGHATLFSPDGRRLFMLCRSRGISVWDRTPSTGALEFLERVRNDAASGISGIGDPGGAAFSPGGGHFYVTSVLGAFASFTVPEPAGAALGVAACAALGLLARRA